MGVLMKALIYVQGISYHGSYEDKVVRISKWIAKPIFRMAIAI
jgi:hypothetical protein